jgi:hypothetical protein
VAAAKASCYNSFNEGCYARKSVSQANFVRIKGLKMWRFSKFDFGRVFMRASVAGLLAACALFGIPRLVGELREYWQERQKPVPVAISIPAESRAAANAAPIPKAPEALALPRPAPMQLVSLQRDPPPLPAAGAGVKPASPASEAELVPAIQKELARLGYYDGPIMDKWSRPVRSAAREFFRKAGSRIRHPQPTAELLGALKAAAPVKKQAVNSPEALRADERPIRPSAPSTKETAPQPSAAAQPPATQNEDYLPPWMIGKTDRARFAAKSETGRFGAPAGATSRELAEAPSSFDEVPKRHFHRRRHAERPWKGRRHYGGYYPRRRAMSFPF